jgi:hypothetical protein
LERSVSHFFLSLSQVNNKEEAATVNAIVPVVTVVLLKRLKIDAG